METIDKCYRGKINKLFKNIVIHQSVLKDKFEFSGKILNESTKIFKKLIVKNISEININKVVEISDRKEKGSNILADLVEKGEITMIQKNLIEKEFEKSKEKYLKDRISEDPLKILLEDGVISNIQFEILKDKYNIIINTCNLLKSL